METEKHSRTTRKFYKAVGIIREMKTKLVDESTEFSKEQIKLLWEEYFIRKSFWNLTLPANCGGIDLENGIFIEKPGKTDDEVFYTLERLDDFFKDVSKNYGFRYRSLFASAPNQRVQVINALLERASV